MKTDSRYSVSVVTILLIFGLVIGLIPLELQAQCKSSILDVVPAPVKQLSLGDIDFEHFKSNALLFTLRLSPSTTGDTAQLRITLDIILANGTTFQRAMDFKSKQFQIPPSGLIITNLDIGRNIVKQDFNYNSEAKAAVQDIALTTGKFPAGKYLFSFTLICSNNIEGETKEIEFLIQNPSRVELRAPRDGEITTEFPLFEFFQDADRAELVVAEKSPDQTREDAISHEPPMNRAELFNQNSFLYSGGRPLEHGKTYAWKVVCKTPGPGGLDIEVSSPVNVFQVATIDQNTQVDALLKILEEIFGSRHPKIFEQIHRDGFNLTGTYKLNDSEISLPDILRLLNELRQMDDNVELSFE